MNKNDYMTAALGMAREAFDDGEVPVGAVIVRTARSSPQEETAAKKPKTPCCTPR